jgi:ribonuclease H
MKKDILKIELEWVRGHAGMKWNERADKTAKSAVRNDFPNYNYERISLRARSRNQKNYVLKD